MPYRLSHALTFVLAATALSGGPMPALAEIGVAAAVNTDARGTPPGGGPRVIALGNQVVFKERISTDASGLVQILLLDGTTFTVGPNSDLTIDEFVYNPATGDAKVVASLTKGAFRFVGARTSQTEGGATINTPIGTIGIRGAIGYISDNSATLVAGKELTITDPDGTVRRIFEAGYTIVQVTGADGSTTKVTRKATAAETRAFQQQLGGKPGTSGGATSQPTNEATEQSGVAQQGSQQLPENNAPVPSARQDAVVAGPPDGKVDDPEEVQQAADDDNREDVIDVVEEQEPDPDQPDPDQPPPAANARLLMTPNVYTGSAGEQFTQALGSRGLVGTTPASDQQIHLMPSGGNLVTPDGTIVLPDYSGPQGDGTLQEFANAAGTWNGTPVSGPAYAGAGDFVAYMLGVNGDAEQPFYVIYGTPSSDNTLLSMTTSSNIRRYTLTEDPIRQSPAPFFADDLYGEMPSFDSASNYLYVIGPGDADDGSARVFQSWVNIEGTGAAQKSAVNVLAGFLYLDEDPAGDFQIDGPRRGSYRHEATSGLVVMRGGVGTVAGADGEHFFGPNADNFVIGGPVGDGYADPGMSPDFTGNPADGYAGDGYPFATHHVADLQDDLPASAYVQTSRTREGFMSGMGEPDLEGYQNGYRLTDAVPDAQPGTNFTMTLDANNNTMVADAYVWDTYDQNPVVAGFQLGWGWDQQGQPTGNGGFVDDDTFGAYAARNPVDDPDDDLPPAPERNVLYQDLGGQVPNSEEFDPGSYIVSGRATPIDGYAMCDDCDFIDWGWWGTRMVSDPDGVPDNSDDREDYVHMGTWVAGEITTVGQLPFGGDAVYDGRAIGTVARVDGDDVAKYIAAGDLHMEYYFGVGYGTIQINDFDGMDLSGTINSNGPSAPGDNAMFGSYDMSTPDDPTILYGRAQGAFVSNGPANPAAGVIGNFDFQGATVTAVGSFAGTQTSCVNCLFP